MSALLHRINSKINDHFYCLNCFHSFRTENKLKSHKKKACENKMPSAKDNTTEFNQYMKSNKIWYIIYANIESLIQKID